MARAEIYPFAPIGEYSGEPYPDWIRSLDGGNGVYFIRDRGTGEVTYIGESHSSRLYSTLTRHFQSWTDKYNTAGTTYDRGDIEVAVILVPDDHALYLQNELICIFDPRDNRLVCGEIFDVGDDDEAHEVPADFDYDVSKLIDAVFYEFREGDADGDVEIVPF